MKKLIAALLLAFTTAAHAGVPCSVPFNLTNGSTADASQVMANYNAILACLANGTAASGANNDITALLALTTPIPPAGGGTTSYVGGSASGTNAIVVGSTVPAGFVRAAGNQISFISTGSNTGATTLTVTGTTTGQLYRETPSGPQPMVGGEIVIGQLVQAVWDGSVYQMVSAPSLGHAPGEVFDYAGASCPVGSLETTGSSLVSQAAYPTLYANITTLWGAAAGGNFTIPDLLGRTTYGRDDEGTRITVAGGNFDGTVVGHVGGQQNQALTSTSQLPPYTPSGTITGSQATNAYLTGGSSADGFTAGGIGWSGGSGASTINGSSFGFSGAAVGSSSPFATLSNAAIVLKCIKG